MNVCRVAYLELRRINFIRNLLSVDAVNTLVCSLVLSRLDYCNSLLVDLSILLRGFKEFKMQQPDQYLEHPDLSTSHHSKTFTGCLSIGEPYTRLLHYVILHYMALNTCLNLLRVYSPARSLRSSSYTGILSTPNVKLKPYGQRSFAYHGPSTWNSLPLALRHQQESNCFKRALKTHLFSLN